MDSGIHGFSAEDIVAADCRYVVFPEGGWNWKGIINDPRVERYK